VIRVLVVLAVFVVGTWLAFVVVLLALRPRGISLREVKRVIPDLLRLLRDVAADRSLPKGVRRRLVALFAYLALPFDLIPDFIPLLGYVDDVIVVAIVLRSIVRTAGPDAVERHWRGSEDGLRVVRSLCSMR